MWAIQTPHPGCRPDHESDAALCDDCDERESESLDSVDDVSDTRSPEEIDKESQSDNRGDDAAGRWTAAAVSRHNQQS